MDLDPALVQRARLVLEDVAQRRATITYTEFSKAVPGVGHRGRKIGVLLEQLSLQSFKRDGTLISVLVVGADSGLPSTGFYGLAAGLRGTEMVQGADTATARRGRNRVYDAHPPAMTRMMPQRRRERPGPRGHMRDRSVL